MLKTFIPLFAAPTRLLAGLLAGLALFTTPTKFFLPRLLSSGRPDFLRISSSLAARARPVGSSLLVPDRARGAELIISGFPDLARVVGAGCLAVGFEMGGSLVLPALPDRTAESLFLDSVRDVVWFITPLHLASLGSLRRNICTK